jgi:F-type H+-transporting ATPase subunit delta
LNGALAQRYAAALADVALEQKSADAFREELSEFVRVFHESHDLRHFLDNPSVDERLKREAVEKIAAAMHLREGIRNFVLVVVTHQRTSMFRDIEAAFRAELNARLGIAEAEVTSARELSESEKKELIEALSRRTGKKISANFHEDKSLLGGAVVRVGSTVYDGSVKEQLERLREQLAAE